MSRASFYPYAVAPDALALECALDPEPERAGGRFVFEGMPDDGVTATFTAELVPGTIERVFPEEERANPPAAVYVLIRSTSSRVRRAFELDRQDQFLYSGEFEIDPDVFFGEVVFEPVLARRRPQHQDDRFATHAAARLAWGPAVTLEVDEVGMRSGNYLDAQFEDFTESANARRREHADLLYVLDTDRSTPKLWLNKAVPMFEQVMKSKARNAPVRKLRDGIYASIGAQVWTSLFSIAVGALSLEGDEENPLDALAELPDWHQRVLNFWAPRVYPEHEKTDALAALARAACRMEGLPDLHDRFGLAVQEWTTAASAFEGQAQQVGGGA
jgi:hypothetical protein